MKPVEFQDNNSRYPVEIRCVMCVGQNDVVLARLLEAKLSFAAGCKAFFQEAMLF
jgi:hypothetical protein